MANFTQMAIEEAFLHLLEERPLAQVTVKDIVERCGINRNTFYYHFSNIPQLIECIVTDWIDSFPRQYPAAHSVEEAFDRVTDVLLARKRAVFHIYHSVNRDIFERYLMNICEYAVSSYCRAALTERRIGEEQQALVIRIYKCLCFGTLIDWLERGMEGDIAADFRTLIGMRIWEPLKYNQTKST